MSTGTSTGAAAAIARGVKMRLVNLLFNNETLKAGSSINPSSDLSIYSYDDLRKAYLNRLQLIHPDKIHANREDNFRGRFRNLQYKKNTDPFLSEDFLKREFQELQEAWDRYEELSKSMTKVIQGDGATANFTKFGVGCSFSDNDDEKALRTEITDQACRGWFTSGLVSSGLTDENDSKPETSGGRSEKESSSLIDDSLFVDVKMSEKNDNPVSSTVATETNDRPRYRPTLVRGIH